MTCKAKPTEICLHGGQYFDFADFHDHTHDIADIAHSLSRQCRFTGHTERHYSVAEHCVYVSMLVDDKHALEALMHDASEYVMGDMASPLKALMPEYKALEDEVQGSINLKFGLLSNMSPQVKRVDASMLAIEQLHIMNNTDDWGVTIPNDDRAKLVMRKIRFKQSAYEANANFLRRFSELTGV